MDLTEECFTKNTLRFVGDTQWIQSAAPGMSNRTAVPALRTTEGTFPAGSQWTRNTIPACVGTNHYGQGDWCTAPLFKPPVWDIWGYFSGPNEYPNNFGFPRSIPDPKDPTHNITRQVVIPDVVVVDLVEVPNLPPGDYVLQYRHGALHKKFYDARAAAELCLLAADCEQTPQVWNSCSDVRLV